MLRTLAIASLALVACATPGRGQVAAGADAIAIAGSLVVIHAVEQDDWNQDRRPALCADGTEVGDPPHTCPDSTPAPQR